MNRIVRWMLSAGLLLAAGAAAAQTPGTVTSLPRPTGFAQIPGEAPPARVEAQSGPAMVPGPPPGPAPELLPPDGPQGCWPPSDDLSFRSRIHADLLEVGLLFPSVNQTLHAPLNVGGLYATTARLPSVSLGFASPVTFHVQFDAWRYGEIDVGWKLLATEGNAILAGLDPAGPAIIRSRLDMNVLDINYASSGYGPNWNLLWFLNQDPVKPLWGLRWDLGVRLASVFYDSQAVGPTVERKVSNFFFGGGPRVGLTLTRQLGDSGMEAFGRVDLGILMGGARQQYSELATDTLGNPLGFGYASTSKTEAVPMLTVQLGLDGKPYWLAHGRWQVGYQYEQWWGVGNAPGVVGNLTTHGLVMKWVWGY